MADEDNKLPTQARKAAVDAFLNKAAVTPYRPGARERGRLMFAIDATASREPTWDMACQIQGEMFEATHAIGGLEVQLAFYRGFGEFKVTKWLTNSKALVRHMTAAYCLGGQTQIGRLFGHALKETKRARVDALVFVGDCVEEDVGGLCHLAGQLGVLGVPIFIFHEGGEPVVARAFRQMARLSNGAYCPFDTASARQLRDLLGAVAVYAAGGRAALSDYGKQRGGMALRLTGQIKPG